MGKGESPSFFKNVVHIGLGTIVNMVIGFISTPIITRIVAPEEYGRLSIFQLYSSIAVMFLCLGLDQTLVRYYYSKQDENHKRGVLLRCITPPFSVFLIIFVAFLVGIYLIKIPFEFEDIPIIFAIGILGELAQRFSVLILRLQNKGKSYAKATILHKALYVALSILLIKITGNGSFFYLALATAISYILTTAYAIYIEKDIWDFRKEKVCDIHYSELIRYGLPFILSMGLTTLFNAIDKLSLKNLTDMSTVGVYSSATTLIGVFTVVQTSFNAVWAPTSVKHYEENPDDKSFYTKYNQIITFVIFGFGLTFILCNDIFGLFLGKSYRDAAQIIPFLALHPIMYSISETTVTGVVVKKKSSIHLIVAAVSCIVNFLGNMLLIPIVGAKGAAISTGLSYIVFYLLRTLFGMKYYYFNHRWSNLFIVTLATVAYAFYNTFFNVPILSVIIYIICMILLIAMYKDTFIEMKSNIMKILTKFFSRK